MTFIEWILNKLKGHQGDETEETGREHLRLELEAPAPIQEPPVANEKEEKRVIIIDL